MPRVSLQRKWLFLLRDDIKEKFVKSIPIRRLAEPTEMSDGVLFILKNEYFTGRMLEIDGGVRM
ncbi:MAG: hypothetical protein CM1200mP30_25740 [Pseudomonadota bacterium]|nr:MAG: hypothetical protein CM1200mP30_25740 [Pseudomonadota bacterium]